MMRRAPEEIPWGANGVDIVVESTGVFTTKEKVWLPIILPMHTQTPYSQPDGCHAAAATCHTTA